MKQISVIALGILLLSMISPLAIAQLVPSDTDYFVNEQNGYYYIFPKLYKNHIPKAVEFNEHIRNIYQTSFSWKLEERASLILTSERNQIANGFATVTPNTMTFFYPSGFAILDQFASPNWFSVLLVHESAHLYQLDAKSKISSLFKSVLGNPIFVITPYVPIFIHPNQLAPGFMLEGNAVMNESTHGIGGRLYSGQARALVYQLLKQDKVTDKRLFNDHLDFPYYTEKYLVGGYFNAFLAKKYGLQKTNEFFLEQGQRFINPLIVNKTFRYHFGKSYSQLIREFQVEHKNIVSQQKQAEGNVLFQGYSQAKMNADENRIWFLVQETMKTPPYLTQINRNQKKWSQTSIDLPMGKVFWINNEPVVATSLQHSIRWMENSLYGEGWRFYPDYRSKIVQDQRAGKTAWIKGDSQFFKNELFVNDQKYADVHSSVILANDGEPIYFVQEKNQRTLMKGATALTSFQGFYGYPLEETNGGAINFIAATPLGSGLFQVRGGKVFQLSPSDLIIDARQMSGDQYIITEITGDAYVYKTIATNPVEAQPSFYDYGLQAAGMESTQAKAENLSSPDNHAHQLPNYRHYSVFKDLRYSQTNLALGTANPGGVQGFISTLFVDPLLYNAYMLSYQRIFDSNSAAVQYILNRYVLKPYIGYLYNEDRYKISGGTEEDAIFYYDQAVFAGFTAPLFIWRRWSGDWNTDVAYEKNDLLQDRVEENVDVTNTLQLTYSQFYPLAYSAYRYFGLTLSHQSIDSSYDLNDEDSVFVGQTVISGDLGWENYFTLQYTEGYAEKDNIRFTYSQALKNDFVRVYRLFPENSIDLKRIRAVEAAYKCPFNTPLYFSRFPMSLRRSALYAEGGYYDAESSTALDSWFIDYRYGIELETLVIHRLPLRIKIGGEHTTESQQSGLMLHLTTKKDF